MKRIYQTTDIVKAILQQDERARNSDSFLYFRVLGVLGQKYGIDIENMSITTFLLNMKEFGFPPFESVRRARQKLQAEHPDLSACSSVSVQRKANEEIIREYARQVGV